MIFALGVCLEVCGLIGLGLDYDFCFLMILWTSVMRLYCNRRTRNLKMTDSTGLDLGLLLCSLAVLDPRVGHTMDVLSPCISVLCHFD